MSQLVAALTAAGFGVLASPLTLVFGLKIRPALRAAADFLAVMAMLATFLLAVQLGSRGELTFYCAAVYAVTLAAAGRALKKLSRRLRTARARRAEERVTKS